MKPVVVIDLFAGAGGFTEGALAAGAKVAVAIDCWGPAVILHRHNHPNVLMIQHELGNLEKDVELIRKYLRRYPNHHIHLHGSPPCQALSNASSTDASKGMRLVLHFLDLVKAIQPDSYSMENVPPVRKRLPDGIPSVMLNAADFGVPQTRRRCVAGEGWEATSTHEEAAWRSTRDALPHLGLIGLHIMVRGYSRTRPVKVNGKHTGVNTPRIPPDGCRELDEVGFTICAAGTLTLWDLTQEPTKIRSLSVKETATLQGFPDYFEWELPGLKKGDIWAAIGNAVCPPVAQAIIRGIIQ